MWRKVHEADLISSLAMSEVEAFRKSAEFENEPVEQQIRQTCAYVRGCIRTGGVLKDAQMAKETDWLPESLVPPAMDYLRFRILTRMNQVVNASRTKSYEDAVALFDQLRRGDFVPEPDSTAAVDETEKATSPLAAEATPPHMLD